MSWAEIKKAINSDLSTPLNELIEAESNNVKNALPSGYNPFAYLNIVTPPRNVYTTIIDLSGRGFLSLCSFVNSAATCRMRITIDGDVKVLLNNTVDQIWGYSAMSHTKARFDSSGMAIPRFASNNLELSTFTETRQYPVTTETSGSTITADYIYFNTSCLIEIEHTNNTEINRETSYAILGGLQ